MINKQIGKSFVSRIIMCLLVLVLSTGGRCIPSAFADTNEYSSVITDLQKDENFNAADYPSVANDYSIQVIQIAESTRGELFVYTYQPCQESTQIVATKVNMSLKDSPDDTKLYALTLVNCNGVFCKYVVDLFVVSNEQTRYYNITSVYRKWIEGIDKPSGTDSTIDSVAFPVGKCFKTTTENGIVTYECKAEEVVQIINPYAGFLEYTNGFEFCTWSHCHSHFVAFSTDKRIDTLLEADVSYYTQQCYKHFSMTSGSWTAKDDPVSGFITVTAEDNGATDSKGYFSEYYEWKRIQSVKDFVNDAAMTKVIKENVSGLQWVLRFLETEYIERSTGVAGSDTWTELQSVTILRLKFITDGVVYNLGAVSNEITPKDDTADDWLWFFKWLEQKTGVPYQVWAVLAVFIVLVVVLLVLSLVFPPFGQFMLVVLKGLWWLICAPFKGIAALAQKIKDKKNGG